MCNNLLAFAGQQLYHPMHHCFMSRRLIYIIACNLQQLNFDELKYWLNSVQAHVYNPDYKYEKYIFLVGTHQRPLGGCHVNESTLKILNDKLKEKFNTDPFLNGIHFYGGSKHTVSVWVTYSNCGHVSDPQHTVGM